MPRIQNGARDREIVYLLNNKGTKMIKVSLEPQESPARNDCVTFIDIVHFRVF